MNFVRLRMMSLFLMMFLCLLGNLSVGAQESVVSSSMEEAKVTVLTKDRQVFESDVNRMAGQISVNQSDFELTYDHKIYDVLPVVFGFHYKHLDIDENLAVSLPARLEGRNFLLGTKFPLPFVDSNQYFVGIDLMPSWYTDGSAWEKSAFRLPFRTYFIYKPSDVFAFVVGATVNVNADTAVTPIIGVNYQPDDRWNIHLASSEPSVSYKLNDYWSLFAEYDAVLDEYEVTRGNQKGVVLKVREAAFGGGLKYNIEKWLEASFSSGASVGRRFAYRDNVGKVDADNAPYVKARLSLKF